MHGQHIFIKELVTTKQKLFSTVSETTLNEAFQQMAENDVSDVWADMAPISEQDRIETTTNRTPEIADEAFDEVPELQSLHNHNLKTHLLYTVENRETIIPDDEGINIIRSLNIEQKVIFNHIINWCYKKLQNYEVSPLRLFITGGAGMTFSI